jgi:hypothetical protein
VYSINISDKVCNYINESYDRGYKAVSKLQARSLKKDEGAYMAGSAIGILVLLVVLMLSALLFATLQAQTDTKIAAVGDDAANASYENIKNTGWGSIDLFGLVPYVAVFIVILGMLMGLSRESR